MSVVTTMSPKGIENLTAPQFLDVNYALNIQNYDIEGVAKLVKRKGLAKIIEVAGGKPPTLLKKWTSDLWVFGYNNTIATYTVSTNVISNIKTDFAVNSQFDGVRVGDYFFVCNGVGKVWSMDNTTYTLSELVNSPTGTAVLTAIGPRLYAGYGDTVQYSEIDTATNPPFTTWSNGTLATDGGKVSYRNAGTVRSIVPLGPYIVVFSDNGFFAFEITTLDSAGTLSKTENIVNYTEDFGGARGAVITEKGILYANESGLWNMTAVGQANTPFSKQYGLISTLLGSKYFDDVDTSNSDIFYDQKESKVLFSCAKGSNTNNLVISCILGDKPVFSKITNWNISRFMENNGKIYGASASATKIYQLFEGYDDDGQTIGTDYYQELRLGDLETKQVLESLYVQGFLSPSSQIKIRFDIYDETGRLVTDKAKFLWETQYGISAQDSYNSATYSSSHYGGDLDYSGMVESFDGINFKLRNWQRIRIHITSSDKVPHVMTWIKVGSRILGKIRRRKLTKLS